jgi:hypothetical protein
MSDESRTRFLRADFPLPLDRPFTSATAAAAGVQRQQLHRLANAGYLRRMVKGTYVANAVPDSTALRCQAIGLIVPEDCVVVDRHAGWLLGAEMILAPNEHLDVRPISVFRPAGMGRLRNGLTDSGERNLTEADVVELNGIRVTTPLRTACDLGRVRWTDRSISAMDAMLRLGSFTHQELLSEVERFRGMRWVTTLRTMAPLADGRSQSPGESVLRLRWIEARIGPPEPQLKVWRDGRLLAVLDIGSEELRYAAEYDGAEWHTSEEQRRHDRERRQAVGDEGWVIDAFACDDVFGPRARPDLRLRYGAHTASRMHERGRTA